MLIKILLNLILLNQNGVQTLILVTKTKRSLSPLLKLKDAIILIEDERIEIMGLQIFIDIPADYEVWNSRDQIVAPGLIVFQSKAGRPVTVDA